MSNNTNTSNASPTTTGALNSAHPLKKRLISEYELEQQRNSPTVLPVEKNEITDELSNNSNVIISTNYVENDCNTEVVEETAVKSVEKN